MLNLVEGVYRMASTERNPRRAGISLSAALLTGIMAALGLEATTTANAADPFEINGWSVTVMPPLAPLPNGPLSKANGETQKFHFENAPAHISAACSQSISVQFNDFSSGLLRGAKTTDEFRPLTRNLPLISNDELSTLQDYIKSPSSPSEAFQRMDKWQKLFPDASNKMPPGGRYALQGNRNIPEALCTNIAPPSRDIERSKMTGRCVNVWSNNDLPVIYAFDPGLCGFDNVAVVSAIAEHFEAKRISDRSNLTFQMPCDQALKAFVSDLDTTFGEKPRAIFPFFELLNRHFPLTGCRLDEAIRIARTSHFLAGITSRGNLHAFGFTNATSLNHHSGFYVGFELTDAGASKLPFAKPNE